MSTRARWWIASFLLMGTLFRAALVVEAEPPSTSDARDYLEFAKSIVEHHRYEQLYLGESVRLKGTLLRAYRPPGFPFIRAIFLSLGASDSPTPILWFNIACELLAALALLKLAIGERRVAHAAWFAVLWAISPTWTANPMTESVTMALWAWVAHEACAAERTRLRSTFMGVLLVFACFVRPISLVFIALIPWIEFRRDRADALRRSICALAPIVLGLSAWGLRNYGVLDSFVLLSTNLGIHSGRDFGLGDRLWEVLRAQGLNEAAINREFISRQLSIIASSPAAACEVFWRRFLDMFNASPDHCFELNLLQTRTLHGAAARLHQLTYLHAPAVYTLAVAASPRALIRNGSLRMAVVLLVAFLSGSALLSRGDMRLMSPAYPLLAYLAAYALSRTLPSMWLTSRGRGSTIS